MQLTIDAQYPGAGKYWVAIKDEHIVAFIAMDAYPVALLPDVGFKRVTPKSIQLMRNLENDCFAEHRRISREHLAKLGTVRSGTFSCCQFYLSEPDGSETIWDLVGPGMALEAVTCP